MGKIVFKYNFFIFKADGHEIKEVKTSTLPTIAINRGRHGGYFN